MNGQELDEANAELGQKPKKGVWFWVVLVLGIIFGLFILLVVGLFFISLAGRPGGPMYPFIPIPKNTLGSTNRHELFMNLLMDTSDTEVNYSVFSRRSLE